MTQIVDSLRPEQQQQFKRLVAIYNAIVYPLADCDLRDCRSACVAKLECTIESRARARRDKCKLLAAKAFGFRGGSPGSRRSVGFPADSSFRSRSLLTTPPLEFNVAAHFLVSFCMSGLIALAYSLCGVEFVVLRGLYPGLWRDAHNFTETARKELAPAHTAQSHRASRRFDSARGGDRVPDVRRCEELITFRAIVAALIVLGILGFHFTSAITNNLSRVLVALTNTKD